MKQILAGLLFTSTIVVPMVIGIGSEYWVRNAINIPSPVSMRIFSSIILGFSLSLIYSFFAGRAVSRLSGHGQGDEIAWGCLNIFVSGTLGSLCAGILAGHQSP